MNDSIDIRVAGGGLVLIVLLSVALWEREIASDVTDRGIATKENGVARTYTAVAEGGIMSPKKRSIVDPLWRAIADGGQTEFAPLPRVQASIG